MNKKNALQNRIRGWIPKKVSFPSTVTGQVNQKTSRHNLMIVYIAIFAAVFATVFITYGILEVLSFGSYSSYASAATAGIAAGIAITLTIRRNQNPNTNKRRTEQ
jgi:membrane associated rhomboid family serine protease